MFKIKTFDKSMSKTSRNVLSTPFLYLCNCHFATVFFHDVVVDVFFTETCRLQVVTNMLVKWKLVVRS